MSSFGALCDRIVRSVLSARESEVVALPMLREPRATAGELSRPQGAPLLDSLRAPPMGDARADAAAERRAQPSISAESCLEMCGATLAREASLPGLDAETFDELRRAQGNPLGLCDFALSCSTCRHADAPSGSAAMKPAPVGDHLSAMARIEATCVGAFGDLAADLEEHGAPADLVVRARHAQDDERVHTVLLGRLASRHGGAPVPPAKKWRRSRTLAAFACQNARERCGADAFNALAMTWAAHTARDLTMRALARRLATDEARHVDLAFEIQGWLRAALPEGQAAQLRVIRDLAIRSVAAEKAPHEVETALGKPSRAVAEKLAERLVAELGEDGLPSARAAEDFTPPTDTSA